MTSQPPRTIEDEQTGARLQEAARLAALRRLRILDTPPEDAFDRFTQLASRMFDMPISLVSFVDENRQWFKSCCGLADYGVFARETPIELSFCVHALKEHEALVIPDTLADPRFVHHAAVVHEPHVRFYAGVPLRIHVPHLDDRRYGERRQNTEMTGARRHGDRRTQDRRKADRRSSESEENMRQENEASKFALGTLCLLDTRPRTFGSAQRAMLSDLAALVENELHLRLTAQQLQREIRARRSVEDALSESQIRFRNAFERSALGMALVSPDGHWLQVNHRLCELLGYEESELLSLRFQDITHPDDLHDDMAQVNTLLAGGADSYQIAKRYYHRDGHIIWAQLDVSLFRDENAVPQYFVSQVQDMTARRTAEESMVAAHAEANAQRELAERANLAKSEFLSRMSHELRTPLNAVLGFGQLLEVSELKPEDRESVVQIIKAGGHLLNLINEILDIARIEAGYLRLTPEAVLLSEIALEAIALVRPLAMKRGLTMEDATIRTCQAVILADRQRLKQAILNLLSNAVKYNRETGNIAVSSVNLPDGSVRLAVRDDGPGISPEDGARLFQPFERLDADRRGIEGTGIGLILSRRLVEAMNGVLDFSSVPGTGSTFWIDMPAIT